MTSWQLIVVSLGCLAMTAVFSGAETGFMSVSRVRLSRGNQGGRFATSKLRALLRDIEDPILTCLIGTNLFAVAFTAVITAALSHRGAHGELLSVAVSSVVMITFGEILPKVLYREFPERLTVATVPLVSVSMTVLTPVRRVLRGYTALWRGVLPQDESSHTGLDTQGLAALLRTRPGQGPDDQRFTQALDSFLRLAGLPLAQLMRPLDEVVSITAETSVADCLAIAARSGFSRLPIASAADGDLRAYVLVRDLLFLSRKDHARSVPRKLWRTLLLVDERMSPYELFEEFRSQGRQVAVVADTRGRPRGLLTLEDLIEKVVGSVRDEFDQA